MNNKARSFKAAFGGIAAALSVLLMFMTGIIPTLTYALPALCGALLMAVTVEINARFSLVVYAAVSILSLLVVADKEAAVMYAAFFGYYPVIKGFLERKLKGAFCWVAKYIIFNCAVICAYFIVSKVFMIPFEGIGESFLGKYAILFFLVAVNAAFAVYDIALTRLVTAYVGSWRKYVKKIFK